MARYPEHNPISTEVIEWAEYNFSEELRKKIDAIVNANDDDDFNEFCNDPTVADPDTDDEDTDEGPSSEDDYWWGRD
jgi:hypothetical protein